MPLGVDPVAEARRNWEAHGWGAADAMVAATSIARAHQVVLAGVDGVLAPLGLTFSRFEALALLVFSRRGALPMGKIGDRLQVHPTSVTNTIGRLERDGLVRRVAA
jgi:DNA-binding MarR family transcriptional regulator